MKKRILYFDALKILSGIAVVFIHVISQYWYNLGITTRSFNTLTFFDSLCRFCVPIYFMISGALFLNEEKNITIKDIFKKYILKIFIVYVFWNICYGTLEEIIMKNNQVTIEILAKILIGTILGKKYFQLGFLVTIIGFYLCVPVLRLITKKENKKILEYLIIILFIFTSLNNTVSALLGIYLLYPLVFGGYLLYFILGYYLHNFELSKKAKKTIYILGVVSALLTAIFTIVHSKTIGYPSEVFFNYISFNVIMFTSALFVLFKNNFKLVKEKTIKILSVLSDTYFGIYILHGLVIGFYLKLGLFDLNLPIPLLTIIIAIIVYITSLIASYIMGKIPVIKKLILR